MIKEDAFQYLLAGTFVEFGEKTAIEYVNQRLTYSELDNRSNGISNWLLNMVQEKGTFIGVLIENRIELISTIIAILKAGCVFVPIDSSLPDKRIETLIRLSDLEYIITDQVNIRRFENDSGISQQKVKLMLIENLETDAEKVWFDHGPASRYSREDKIYIYFTSGSTGNPKGVVGKNKSLKNYIQWEVETFRINKESRVAQLATPGFDAFLKEIFVAFVSGATLCIPEKIDVILDAREFARWIENSRINVLHCVPSLFRLLNSEQLSAASFPNLEYILMSGESIFPGDIKQWYEKIGERIQLVNLYGLTETTILSTYYLITKSDTNRKFIPIGKPIKGTRIVMLDENMKICNKGMIGEIYIRTPYRTFGYYNDSDLNSKRFMPNPFNNDPGDLIYRTGDLGRLLEDGNIEFIGRMDRQVKMRGIRIELAEIESYLMSHPMIKEAVVLKATPLEDRTNSDVTKSNDFLYTYLTLVDQANTRKEEGELISDIKEYLCERLPDYLVPAKIMCIDEIPRLVNKKIDYKTLTERFKEEYIDYIPPRDDIEVKLMGFWSKILAREKIGVTNHFFEIGGNSLNIMSLIFEIHKEFDILVSIGEIFNNPSIEAQAKIIREARKDIYLDIEPVEKREYYPLSSAQKRVFFMRQLESGYMSYNIPQIIGLQGDLDRKKLEEAFNNLIQSHESFRTSFLMVAGTPMQKIHDEVNFAIDYFESDEEGSKKIINDFLRPFDLSHAPLLRVGLIKVAEKRHIILIDMYHIITDGRSDYILVRDLMTLYQGEYLPSPVIQYKDFTEWQNRYKQKEVMKKQENYWLRMFTGEIPKLNLPYDYQRPPVQDFEGDFVYFTIGKEETEKLRELAFNEESTLFIVLLAILNVLLARLGGQEDVIVGTPIAGRSHQGLQAIIGMFVNNLVLRNFPVKEKKFREFIREVRALTLEAFENQNYQFEDLVEKVEVDRDASRNPIFDVKFQFEKRERLGVGMPDLQIVSYEFENKTSKFDLCLDIEERAEELFCDFNFRVKLFNKETVEVMAGQLKNIISSVLKDPEKQLMDIELISTERKEVLLALNVELKDELKGIENYNHTFQNKLLDTFSRFKNKVAIEYGERMITYLELTRRSNYIANWITQKRITNGTFLGILMNDRIDIISTVIAVLKTGCVIVPLYSAYPDSRIESMMNTTDLNYVFADRINLKRFESNGLSRTQKKEFIPLEEMVTSHRDEWFQSDPPAECCPNDPLYIHFTSGTTGKPKAIIGRNESLLHFIEWEIQTFNVSDDFRVAQFTIPGFDPFLRDIFAPLCSGGVVCVPKNEEILLNAEELINWVDGHHISLIHCVSSLFRLLASGNITKLNFKSLRSVLLAGEKISPHDLEKWYGIFDERIGLFNLYGPTETTMSKVFYPIKKSDLARERIPIGKPIKGARVVILKENRELCAELERGEIYVRTPFRSLEYYNDLVLNKTHFVQNPFNDEKGDILYKSGDLGRFLADGNIDILGRVDRQVKIRGYRIELEEIEHLLVKHPRVNEAVVLKRELANKNELLTAYITTRESSSPAGGDLEYELTKYLAEKLPDYMVPAAIIMLEEMPRKETGKVDLDVLSDFSREEAPSYIAPRDEIERKLVDMWCEIFGVKKIGITDHFFKLGGNSLNVMNLIAKIHRELDIRISLGDVFNNLTIEKLARIIRASREEKFFAIVPVERKEYYSLSAVQKRLYILQQMVVENTSYNIPTAVTLHGRIDKEKLAEVFIKLINRHENLRVSFVMLKGGPVQKVHKKIDFQVEFYERETAEVRRTAANFIQPFDLSKPTLLRVGLIKTGESEYILIVDLHHIIADSISLQVLVQEFMMLYGGGRELSPLKLQYKDYSEWQNRQKDSTLLARQEEYWLEQFKEDFSPLNIPSDFPKQPVQNTVSRVARFEIEEKVTQDLKNMAEEEGVTIYILMLTFFNVLISRLSDQDDIIIGTDAAGRRHADLGNTIGMFVNTLAIRSFPKSHETFRQFLSKTRKSTLDAFENQDYQFDDLVEKLGIERDVTRNPLFDVMFAFYDGGQTVGISEVDFPGLKLRSYDFESRASKFDMILHGVEVENKIKFEVEYSTDLFKERRIKKYIRFFCEIIDSVIKNRDIQLKDIVVTHELISAKSDVSEYDFKFELG